MTILYFHQSFNTPMPLAALAAMSLRRWVAAGGTRALETARNMRQDILAEQLLAKLTT